MANQTPKTNPPEKTQTNHKDILREAEEIRKVNGIADRFSYYIDTLHRKVIALSNPKTKQIATKRASHSSRYMESGIAKIRNKIRQRLSAYPATFGTMLTFTIAEIRDDQKHYEGMDRLEAWEKVNKECRRSIDEINKWRKRHNLKKIKGFVKVLEIQTARLYPHLHMYCPGLKYVAPISVIQKLWPFGNVDIQHTDSTSPANYITKYLSKLDGKDFMNLMLFEFHLRMYSSSRDLKYSEPIRNENGWGFFAAGNRYQLDTFINQFLLAGYSMAGERLTEPRGP